MKKTSIVTLFLAALLASTVVGCSSSKKEDLSSTEPTGSQTVAQNSADSDSLKLGASSAGRAH